MRFIRNHSNRAGYTITELMVVVAIIGILAVMVIPAFAGFLRASRFQGAQSQLMTDIYFARSLAISRHRTIAIRFSAGQYLVVDTSDNSVAKTTDAPSGVTFATTANPNFYSWGLADPVNITVTGLSRTRVLNLLPTGTVTHGS